MATKNPTLVGKIIQSTEAGSGYFTDTGVEVIDKDGNILSPVVPGDIPLANGKILKGNASAVAAPVTLGASFTGASDTTSSVTAGTPAGTVAAPVFTGAASVLNLASPSFSGTGLTAAGQVMTTTDNQTMTLNQCAGMWLIPATGSTPPMLILSNTAVVAAPAVLTVQGAAATDAGAYKIVANIPVGTNSAPVFSGAALAGHTHTVTPTGTVTPTYT